MVCYFMRPSELIKPFMRFLASDKRANFFERQASTVIGNIVFNVWSFADSRLFVHFLPIWVEIFLFKY